MKKFLFVLLICAFAGQAWGATFYLRADGEAAIGETTGCTSAATAASVTAHNAVTFSGDDIIYVCDNGGTYSDRITVPSSGTSGHLITYQNAPGHSPIIDVAAALSAAFYSNGKDYIKVQGIHFKNATGGNIYFDGVCDGTQIINNISTGGVHSIFVGGGTGAIITGNTINQGSGAGVWLYDSLVSVTMTGNNFVGSSGKTSAFAVKAYLTNGIIFSNNTFTDWSLDNAGVVTHFEYAAVTSGTGNVINYTSYPATILHGYYFLGCVITSFSGSCNQVVGNGLILAASSGTLNNMIISGSKLSNILINGASIVTLNNPVSYGASAGNETTEIHGLQTGDDAAVIINGGSFYSNKGDGINGNGTGSITCNRVLSYSNGATGSASSGDGFTTHDSCGLYLNNCIAHSNFKSGVAVVGTGNGSVYNCTFYNNYEASQTGNYGIFINSSGTWNVKNNITANHEYEIYTGALAAGTLNIDYNNYYASRGLNAYVWQAGEATNFAGWKTASSGDSHSINSDPRLTPIYTISGGSSSVGAGIPILTYAQWIAAGGDYVGRNPTNGTFSIGAYQYQKQMEGIPGKVWDSSLKKSKSTDAGSYVQP
jgi:hypothetical protein